MAAKEDGKSSDCLCQSNMIRVQITGVSVDLDLFK